MILTCLHNRLFYFIKIALFGFSLAACAVSAPVQEMSNARQSIGAAEAAGAGNLAASLLSEAQQRLRSATRELDAGEYERARLLALESIQLALKARQLAVSKSK